MLFLVQISLLLCLEYAIDPRLNGKNDESIGVKSLKVWIPSLKLI